MKRKFVGTSEGEEYLHKETWRVVKRQFERPDNPNRGAMYDDLVAMVFAAYTLEGYLNFVGDRILPGVWQNERGIEGGLEGKLTLARISHKAKVAEQRLPESEVGSGTYREHALTSRKTVCFCGVRSTPARPGSITC